MANSTAKRQGLPGHLDGALLRFKISTGLKRVLGRDLITDDEVAIFELVKNSFDAGAQNVILHFGNNSITIIDDGQGMTLDEIKNKWLFVAYSSKREINRDNDSGYREQIAERVQNFAGSKGIGRFSSDRLGQDLILQTRSITQNDSTVQVLHVDWSKFEHNDVEQFGEIEISHSTSIKFDLPNGVPTIKNGTIIKVRNLRKEWSRNDILRLKIDLAKLVNPFGAETDRFGILVVAPNEVDADDQLTKLPEEKKGSSYYQPVNGRVGNPIFSILQEKTTYIEVNLDSVSNKFETTLVDRGEIIYKIKETNEHSQLSNSKFRCKLFYLNRAAKANFTRRVGLPPIQFGSVFLFRNEFRVFPIGDDGNDWFGVDRRKQQGYNRFLGSRDIIGRIDIYGNDEVFQEASSRNQGLIENEAVEQLKNCFREQCFKRLERYVVPVSWPSTADLDSETLAALETDSGRARITSVVANLIGNPHIELLSYSKRLIGILNERSEQFESSLAGLRLIASTIKDPDLTQQIAAAELRFKTLKESEVEAHRIADEERKAKIEAQNRALLAEERAKTAQTQLGEEKKRNLFLASIASLDTDTILNMHHQVTIYAADLQQQIENMMVRIGDNTEITREFVINGLESISLLNKKILAVAKFATKANFRLDSECIEEDLEDYIVSYINGVARDFLTGRITLNVVSDGKPAECRFKPIDVSIVIDNLVSNARRARASRIDFDLTLAKRGILEIRAIDDGKGIAHEAIDNGRLFEKGFTTTGGSGLGLFHVRQVLDSMKGSIEATNNSDRGAAFLIRIPL